MSAALLATMFLVRKLNIISELPINLTIALIGYTRDLRCHPARSMLHYGVPISISSDDPCFFDYEGVTLDYVYVFIAWELDIADLKKLCLNSLEYSSVSAEEKKVLGFFFEQRWKRFLEYVRGKF